MSLSLCNKTLSFERFYFLIAENLETIKDMNLKKLFVNGCIPKSGEYSLIINKVDKRAKKTKDPVVCYLVATEVDTASGMLDYFEKPETLDAQKNRQV